MKKKHIKRIEISETEWNAVAKELHAVRQDRIMSGERDIELGLDDNGPGYAMPTICRIYQKAWENLHFDKDKYPIPQLIFSGDQKSQTTLNGGHAVIEIARRHSKKPEIFLAILGHEMAHQLGRIPGTKMCALEVRLRMLNSIHLTPDDPRTDSSRKMKIKVKHRIEHEADLISYLLFGERVITPFKQRPSLLRSFNAETHPEGGSRVSWLATQIERRNANTGIDSHPR